MQETLLVFLQPDLSQAFFQKMNHTKGSVWLLGFYFLVKADLDHTEFDIWCCWSAVSDGVQITLVAEMPVGKDLQCSWYKNSYCVKPNGHFACFIFLAL